MRYSYALLGVAFIILIGALIFLLPGEEVSQEQRNINTNDVIMLTLTSSVFEHNSTIPLKYTCDGDDVNPPLTISNVPDGTKSLALIMDDPDVPKEVNPAQIWNHWVVFNIPPDTTEIAEASNPGVRGKGSYPKMEYGGPCPPTKYEPTEHRYFFKLYALDTELSLEEGATKEELESAMDGHVIGEAELVGRYDRAK